MTKKYIAYCTPKAFASVDKDELPEECVIIPTHWVYINMMEGWSAEECDNVVYIVENTEEEVIKFKKEGM